jgi:hypothetical protein
MKAADIEKARELLAEMKLVDRLAKKLEAGDGLRLMVGQGSSESEIVLSEAFADEVRTRILNGLIQRRGMARTALAGMGVEL